MRVGLDDHKVDEIVSLQNVKRAGAKWKLLVRPRAGRFSYPVARHWHAGDLCTGWKAP